MTGASGIDGGIAKSNLNIIKVLSTLALKNKIDLSIFSLLEKDTDKPESLSNDVIFNAFFKNKYSYSTNLIKNISNNTLFIFDHVSLALPLLPFAISGMAKTVIFAHGSESWKRLKYLNKLSFKNSKLSIANSFYTLNKMRSIIGSFNGIACPLGLSPEFKLNKEISDQGNENLELTAVDGKKYKLGDRFLLLVARIHQDEGEKGHKQLIEILPRLLNKYPNIQLVFPGSGGGVKDLEDLSKKLKVESSVFFPGFVSNEMLSQYYSKCYAFVMPSSQEGFGLVYLEAMNYCKPCIGCYDQGAEDIIVNNQTGYLINSPKDLNELYNSVCKLLDNPLDAKDMGINGFKRLHQEFTSEKYQERLIIELEKLLDGINK